MLHRQFNFRILQSTLSILHNYPKRKTFLVFRNTLSDVNIEQLDILNEGRQLPFQPIEQGLQSKVLIDDDGEITNHRREFGDLRINRNPCRRDRSEVDFEHHGRQRQIVFLHPFRVQFADATDVAVIEDHACGTPGMQCRMNKFLEAQSGRRQQCFEVTLDVIEINLARPAAPSFRQRAAVGQAGEFPRLPEARNRSLPERHAGKYGRSRTGERDFACA